MRNEAYRSQVIAALRELDPGAATAYETCGELLGWVEVCEYCAETEPDFYHRAIRQTCHLRICPDCAARLAAAARERYAAIIEYLTENPNPGYSFRHIVLTRSLALDGDGDGDKLSETLDLAMRLCRELILAHPLGGAIATVEVGEQGARFHVHILAYCRWIAQVKLSELWRELTESDYVVWITRQEGKEAIEECLKYVVKATALRPEQLAHLHVALKGRRRVRSCGIFYRHPGNPYAWLLAVENRCSETFRCPNCEMPTQLLDAAAYVSLVARWVGVGDGSLDAALAAHRQLRLALNLTQGNNSSRDPPT